MAGTFLGGVTLSALGLEDFLSSLGVAGRSLVERRHCWSSCGEDDVESYGETKKRTKGARESQKKRTRGTL